MKNANKNPGCGQMQINAHGQNYAAKLFSL